MSDAMNTDPVRDSLERLADRAEQAVDAVSASEVMSRPASGDDRRHQLLRPLGLAAAIAALALIVSPFTLFGSDDAETSVTAADDGSERPAQVDPLTPAEAEVSSQVASGYDAVLFLEPDVTSSQLIRIERTLESTDSLLGYTWVSQDEAFDEFEDLFAQHPDLVKSVSPGLLPPSYRLEVDGATAAECPLCHLSSLPGVRRLVDRRDGAESPTTPTAQPSARPEATPTTSQTTATAVPTAALVAVAPAAASTSTPVPATRRPTLTPRPAATATATATAVPIPQSVPATATATAVPTATLVGTATAVPTRVPTAISPTAVPPTAAPTMRPTAASTATAIPSVIAIPVTTAPTATPRPSPTPLPTATAIPTSTATAIPTVAPSPIPTPIPTAAPSCPAGYDGPVNGQCTRRVFAQPVSVLPTYSCPAGSSGSPSAASPTCNEAVPAVGETTWGCPPGYFGSVLGPGDTCLADDGVSPPTTSVEITIYRCPSGTTGSPDAGNPTCSRTVPAIVTESPTDLVCPPGSTGSPTDADPYCTETVPAT